MAKGDSPDNKGTAAKSEATDADKAWRSAVEQLPPSVRENMKSSPEELAREVSKSIANTEKQNEAYRGALKTELDAELNWNRALPKGETVLTAAKLKERLQDPKLEPESRGFLKFLDDNFSKIAGVAGRKDKGADKATTPGATSATELSINDATAVGGMNQINPEKMDAGVKFLQDNFFKLSGMDNKVSSERMDRLLFDHAFQFYSKETQDRMYDVADVVKASDQRPQSFSNGARTKSGLQETDAAGLKPNELVDSMRIQALQKAMYGRSTAKYDGKSLSKDAESQYEQAKKRYTDLRKNGLDDFLQKLDK